MTADGIFHRAGEGQALFGGRIVIKADFEQLCITESQFVRARPGAGPHVHRLHADSFYVLEGGLALLVHDTEHPLGPGACACLPPGVVHGFRSTSAARFLNFHTPDGGFAANLQALDRGEAGGFDSFDVPIGRGLPGINVAVLPTGEGERLEGETRVATIKIGRDELSLIEFDLQPEFEGPEPHTHDDRVDAFYVLEGEVEFQLGDKKCHAGAGAFVAAPPGVVHTFTSGPGRSRLLNVHAPSGGFHDWLRELG